MMKILNLKVVILKLFRRPKVLISASIIAVIFCLAVSKFLLSAYYVAAARILVSTDIIGEGGAEEELLLSDRVLNTTVEVLKSRDFIREVVKELNLEDAFGKSIAVDRVVSMVRIRPVEGTDIIEISVRSNKAELATLIANAMSKVVITHSARDRFSFENDIVSWISEKSSVMKKELEDSRTRLQEFKESAGVADLETGYDTAMQRLIGLEQDLDAARMEREKLESTRANIENFLKSGKRLEELPLVMNDADFKQMQSKYDYNKTMVKELLKTYQPSHPQVAELTEEISRLEVSLDARAKEIVNDIEIGYKTAKAEEETLQKIVDEQNKKVLNLEKKINEYKMLLYDLREKEAIFNTFLEEIKKEYIGGLRLQQLSLAEQAYLPRRKEGPPTPKVIFIGLLLGMATTIAYNIWKDKDTLFIEKTKVSPPKEKEKITPPKGKGMYIERVTEEGEEE